MIYYVVAATLREFEAWCKERGVAMHRRNPADPMKPVAIFIDRAYQLRGRILKEDQIIYAGDFTKNPDIVGIRAALKEATRK